MDSITNKLIIQSLIQESEKQVFSSTLVNSGKLSNSKIFKGMEILELNKIMNKRGSSTIPIKSKSLSNRQQDSINRDLRDYLNKIKRAGLIKPEAFKDFNQEISQNKFSSRFRLLYALHLLTFYQEWLSQDRLFAYGNLLFKNKILKEKAIQTFFRYIQNHQIISENQILNNCDQHLGIDTNNMRMNSSWDFENFYKNFSNHFPELEFTKLSNSLVKDANPGSVSNAYYSQTSFISHGKTYSLKTPVPGNQEPKLGTPDYEIFNLVLADLGSPYRIFRIIPHLEFQSFPGHDSIYFLELKKEQVSMFRTMSAEYPPFIDISDESFQNNLSPELAEQAWMQWKSIGLLDYLKPEEIEKVKSECKESGENLLPDMIRRFPNLIARIPYKMEGKKPYQRCLENMVSIAHTKIKLEGILDSLYQPEKKYQLGYSLNKKKYRFELQEEMGNFNFEWIPKFNKSIQKNAIQGKFYYLNRNEPDAAYLIFLNPNQAQVLLKQGLILKG